MAERLCPKCGAYWACDCVLDDVQAFGTSLGPLTDPGCEHDWVDAVGVDRDEVLPDGARVLMCRLCGLYAVTTSEQVL